MKKNPELHVGIIMDGNGRWAANQGLTRYRGHTAGARAVRSCVQSAPDFGVSILTLYAFSANNWSRPANEVRLLLRLFERHLHKEIEDCVQNSVRLQVIGRRDRLGIQLCAAIDAAERATEGGKKLLLRLAIDYSARDTIRIAAERLQNPSSTDMISSSDIFGQLVSNMPYRWNHSQDVDLIIRTGGEQRLSDFLLWEGAYAELYFTDVMWPDFDRTQLKDAIATYNKRERRFGCVPTSEPPHDHKKTQHVSQDMTRKGTENSSRKSVKNELISAKVR